MDIVFGYYTALYHIHNVIYNLIVYVDDDVMLIKQLLLYCFNVFQSKEEKTFLKILHS